MRKWTGLVPLFIVVLLLGVTGCERSVLPPAPTLQVTGTVLPTGQVTPTPTLTDGQTVIVATTPTATSEVTGTVMPTATPTTPVGATATPTTPVSATATPTVAPGGGFEYIVQAGDTLWGLALRFGTTIEAIKARNNLTSNVIYKGQKLIIPGTPVETVTHVVQRGENLFRIALNYGTTVEAIAAANGIINPNLVYAGQKLIIPKGSVVIPSPGGRYHVVQRGETLWSISMRYGTTPWKIAAANGIANPNFIYAGRTLRIP